MKNGILSRDGLSRIEVVTGVTDVYAPIWSTNIVDALEGDGWKFAYAQLFRKNSSAHCVAMKRDDTTIIFLNSYNGTLAFRFYLLADNLAVPVSVGSLERVIHKGDGARELDEEFRVNTTEIWDAVQTAKIIHENIRNLKISESLKNDIIDVVFESVKKTKNFLELDLVISERYDTIKGFAEIVIEKYIDGDYLIIKNDHNSRKGRKITSKFRELTLKNKVFNKILESHPELLI